MQIGAADKALARPHRPGGHVCALDLIQTTEAPKQKSYGGKLQNSDEALRPLPIPYKMPVRFMGQLKRLRLSLRTGSNAG